jgi:hypothetical protein
VLYVDGTFKSAPQFFHQLFTIRGLSNGHYVPLAFSLLTNKHQTSYEDVFRHTASEAAKLGVNVFPPNVCADFETAIHNAVTTVWSGCEVKACLPFRTELVTGNTIFGTQQAVWKERF